MGRNAPDPIYDFEVCYTQTYYINANTYIGTSGASSVQLTTGAIKSGYFSNPIEQGHDVVVSLPVGATGAAITGCTILGRPEALYGPNSFYPNNSLVVINDEKRAVLSTNNLVDNASYTQYEVGGNSFKIENRINQGLYQPAISMRGQDITGGISGTPTVLKVTGVTASNPVEGNVSGGYVVDYTKLHSNYSLITTYGNFASASGRRVLCQLIESTSTGVIVRSGLILNDTLNNSATNGYFCVPSVAKDLSYTGANLSRVLIGYQSDTGVTSGQLCAQLLEISGTTLTTGDPVVVRSVAATGFSYSNFIKVTHHFIGSQNAFVIATATTSGGQSVAPSYTVSGQLIAANPASGVTLSGSFGSAVIIMNSTGATSSCSQPVCTALNTFTGNNAYGVVIGVTGALSATGTLQRQMYEVSGNTITTGITIVTGVLSLIDTRGNNWSNNNTYRSAIHSASLGTGYYHTPKLSEVSSNLKTSGLVCHIGYGGLITASGHVLSGFSYINMVHVPYSLTSTGVTQYATLNGGPGGVTPASTAIVNSINLNFPTNLPFFVVSGNPYSGVHGSYIELVPKYSSGFFSTNNNYISGMGLTTLTTATGYFPSGNVYSGFFGGVFFSGGSISGISNMSFAPFAQPSPYQIRSAYVLTSSGSYERPSLFSYSSGLYFSGGTAVILDTLGTYPNITGLTIWQNPFVSGDLNISNMPAIYRLSLPSITGEQLYVRSQDIFKSPGLLNAILSSGVLNNRASGYSYYNYPPGSIGVIINETTGNSNAYFQLTDKNFQTTGQVTVKVARNEKAKRQLIDQALGQFTITENKTIFQ